MKQNKFKSINLSNVASVLEKVFLPMVADSILQQSQLDEFAFGKIVGYRDIKVPVYLRIKVPVIVKHYCEDSEYGQSEFMGWLISFREVSLFRIGTKIEKEPIRKESNIGGTINFVRNKPLNETKS